MIIAIVPDHMVVVRPLPERNPGFSVCKAFQCGDQKRDPVIERFLCRGIVFGDRNNHVDVIGHDHIFVDSDIGIEMRKGLDLFLNDPAIAGMDDGRRFKDSTPLYRAKQRQFVFCADSNKIGTVLAVAEIRKPVWFSVGKLHKICPFLRFHIGLE